MFNDKRRLSLIKLLIIGICYQILLVSANISECIRKISTECYVNNFSECVNYCTINNKIYCEKIGEISCKSPLNGGYYLFDNESKLISKPSISVKSSNLYLIGPNSSIKKQTNPKDGYYKNFDDEKNYIQCKDKVCTLVANPTSEFNNDCTVNSGIGRLSFNSTIELCLNGLKKVPFTTSGEKNYLVSYSENSIFTFNQNHFGIVKVGVNSMIINTNFTSNKEICASDESLEVTNTINDFCINGKLLNLCTNGICKMTCNVKTGTNCVSKTYHLVDSTNLLSTSDISGRLFYCQIAGKECTEISDKGFYANSATDAFSCSGKSGECKKELLKKNYICRNDKDFESFIRDHKELIEKQSQKSIINFYNSICSNNNEHLKNKKTITILTASFTNNGYLDIPLNKYSIESWKYLKKAIEKEGNNCVIKILNFDDPIIKEFKKELEGILKLYDFKGRDIRFYSDIFKVWYLSKNPYTFWLDCDIYTKSNIIFEEKFFIGLHFGDMYNSDNLKFYKIILEGYKSGKYIKWMDEDIIKDVIQNNKNYEKIHSKRVHYKNVKHCGYIKKAIKRKAVLEKTEKGLIIKVGSKIYATFRNEKDEYYKHLLKSGLIAQLKKI